MIYNFKTEDDEIFVLNTETLKWGRASSILSAPSVTATEHGLAQYVFSEEGALVPQGAGLYNLDGRTPQSQPGNGLSTVRLLTIPYSDKIIMFLHANVAVKEDSFKCGMVEAAQKFLVYKIQQPEKPGGQLQPAE